MNEFFHLVTNPAHWMFEVVSDLVLAVILYFPLRKLNEAWHHRHDKEVHKED